MTTPPPSRVRRRLQQVRADGDRGSLALAMLVTLVATSIAALILPMFVTSAGNARFDDRRARQLSAAQSGVEVTIARLRGATGSVGSDGSNGVRQLLPCTPILGTVVGDASLRYRATVQYFTTDPALLTSAAEIAAAVLPCVTGAGPSTASGFPGYARITAVGTDVTGTTFPTIGSRSVSATYVLQTTNANIAGGLIRVTPTTGANDLCLDAGDAPWPASTVITMQRCDATRAGQIWAYNPNVTFSLVASVTAAAPLGLCVDSGGVTPQVDTAVGLTLQPCAPVTVPRQQWSINDWGAIQGTDDGQKVNGKCWTVQSRDRVGSLVVLQSDCGNSGGYNNVRNWYPQASVGAGAAGARTGQLVNYAQFGRCLDVTSGNVGLGYLIAWPCKQSPSSPVGVLWNQKWRLPAVTNGTGTGQVVTTPGADYCLSVTATDAFVQVVTPCTTPTPATTWKVRTASGDYASSYQIESTAFPGWCLTAADLTAEPTLAYPGGVSKIVVRPCTASLLQKWNAPPDVGSPTVRDQTEN